MSDECQMPQRRIPLITHYSSLLTSEYLSRDDDALNLAGALADGAELRIAPVLFRRVIFDVAIAAVYLHGLLRYANGDFAGVELGHRGLFRRRLAGVLQGGGLIRQQARRFDLCRHVGELELNRLELGNRAPELVALAGVLQRRLVSALRGADRQRRN